MVCRTAAERAGYVVPMFGRMVDPKQVLSLTIRQEDIVCYLKTTPVLGRHEPDIRKRIAHPFCRCATHHPLPHKRLLG